MYSIQGPRWIQTQPLTFYGTAPSQRRHVLKERDKRELFAEETIFAFQAQLAREGFLGQAT